MICIPIKMNCLDPEADRKQRTNFTRRILVSLHDLRRAGTVEKIGAGRGVKWKPGRRLVGVFPLPSDADNFFCHSAAYPFLNKGAGYVTQRLSGPSEPEWRMDSRPLLQRDFRLNLSIS
jgi:hypothetical protein